jgi:hypothetical protein
MTLPMPSPIIDRPFRLLAVDIRQRSINAVVALKRRGTMHVERAVSVRTVGPASDAVGKDLIAKLCAGGLPTVTAIDARHVATTTIVVAPYIEARDYDGLANRSASKLHRPPNKARRIRWRPGRQNQQLLLSVANEQAVTEVEAKLRAWGCRPWIIADPSIVWLETFAPNGIVDDFDATTLFAAPDRAGIIRNDIIPHEPDATRFLTAATNIIQSEHLKSPIDRLAYFGSANRFTMLRASLSGINITLGPAVPPEHETTQPWTFALALAAYGAAQ